MAKTRKSKSRNSTTRKSKSLNNNTLRKFVHKMLEVENTIRVFHWKTSSYSAHKTTDKLHDKISDLVDKFVETYMGKKNIRVSMKDISSIKFKNLNTLDKYLKNTVDFLNDLPIKNHADLISIRDEIVTQIHKSLYLFSF